MFLRLPSCSFFIAALAMRLLLFLPFFFLQASAAQPVEMPATKPAKGQVHRWVGLPATLAPWQQVVLHAKVTGYVKDIAVDKGDPVKAGQVLARLEVPELQADLVKHEAEVAAAQVEVNRLHEARRKSPDLILPQAVDDAEARLSIARAGLARTTTMLAFAEIKAPFDGVVTARHVDLGALVNAGAGKVLEIMDVSTLRLQIPVTEMETGLVAVGKPVKALIEAAGAKPFEGAISRISYALDPTTRTMLAEADFKNTDMKLRPGMYVMAKIGVEKHEDATLIPVAGLVMEKTAAFVFKFVDGKAVKTPVTLGFNDGAFVEVPALKTDEVVLLPGTALLTDKQPVSVKLQ